MEDLEAKVLGVEALGVEVSSVEEKSEVARVAEHRCNASDTTFAFLPQGLVSQCRGLIESFHELHGYAGLPNILWKSGLGPFIENEEAFRLLLRTASTTRSAKKSNQGFVTIATTILSLEILASRFAGWGELYPCAASKAQAILKTSARGPYAPLIDFYLYPPKYPNAAAISALLPPKNIHVSRTDHETTIVVS